MEEYSAWLELQAITDDERQQKKGEPRRKSETIQHTSTSKI